MRRTTTRKLRNSPGVYNEGRTHGLERNVQNPVSPRISPFASKALGGHVRAASGRSPGTTKFADSFHSADSLASPPSPYRRTTTKSGRAAASAEPAPESPTRQRRQMYKNGTIRGAVEKRSARSMLDLTTDSADVYEPASPRQAAFLANQKKQNVQDEQQVQALVSKMKTQSAQSPVEKQLDAVLEFLNQESLLNTQGLHRVCGRQSEIDGAVAAFKSGQLVVPNDAHVACGLLKELFKQTFKDGEALIPRSLQFGLVMMRKQAIAERADPIKRVLAFFKQFMPPRNMKAFRKILAHLVLVAAHSEKNLMGVENLAKLFGVWLYEATGEKDLFLQLEYSEFFAEVMKRLIEERKPVKN